MGRKLHAGGTPSRGRPPGTRSRLKIYGACPRRPHHDHDGPAARPARAAARAASAASGLRGLLLLDDLALDLDLDLLADDEPAVQDRVEAQAEVLPVDLGGGAVGDPVPHHPRVVELAVLYPVERHRMGVALDGQVTGQRV